MPMLILKNVGRDFVQNFTFGKTAIVWFNHLVYISIFQILFEDWVDQKRPIMVANNGQDALKLHLDKQLHLLKIGVRHELEI